MVKDLFDEIWCSTGKFISPFERIDITVSTDRLKQVKKVYIGT